MTLDKIKKMNKTELINMIFNWQVSDLSDGDEGKKIPYIGWFWRSTDFVNKKISIGKIPQGTPEMHIGDIPIGSEPNDFIGVMENNKWAYPERYMTEEEVDIFIDFINRAVEARNQGGMVNELIAQQDAILQECHDWFQTLKIN